MSRAARAAYWIAPSVLCLVVYWLGLKAWFRQDDFAWLSLHLQLQETGDLWTILFAPMAQGTIRPLSERVFFISFYALFGLNVLPYRLMVFATQFANLMLVASICRRLTHSSVAGFCAAVFWLASSSLVMPMSWSSAYNQILCAFFLLLSFHLLLRHIETGKRSYFIWQWVTFLLGFGALEINVVYPALAAGYTFCCARRHFRKTLWMFPVSAAYAAVHMYASPKPSGDLYKMYFDGSMLSTLWTYWQWTFGAARLQELNIDVPAWVSPGATTLLTVAILGFAAWRIRRRQWLAAFFLAWFLIVLAPVLPLRDHISDYYLTVPVIGLALLGGWAFAVAWKARWIGKTAAVLLAAVYIAASLPLARAGMRWHYENGLAVRTLVRGVARARELHPGKVILLTGVDSDLFWGGIFDKPFRIIGVSDVYLAPGSEGNITEHPALGNVSDFVLPAGPALRALEENRAVVYAAGGPRLKNVTAPYRAIARYQWPVEREPQRVDAGNQLFAGQLGPSWYEIEGAYRWMPKRATVRLGGPGVAGQKLYVSGFCPAQHLEQRPLHLTVSVDGRVLPTVAITRTGAFDFSFPLPAELVGKDSMEVALEVDRTLAESVGGRALGLVFGTFAVR